MLGAVLGGAFLGGLADRMKENREYVKEKSDTTQEYLWKAGLERQQDQLARLYPDATCRRCRSVR